MSNSLRARVNKLAHKGELSRTDADRIRDALAKQIPMEVVYKMGCHGGVLCPNCRITFEYRMDNWKSPFCQYCGQRIDWSEVE